LSWQINRPARAKFYFLRVTQNYPQKQLSLSFILIQGCKNAVAHSSRATKNLECANGVCSDVVFLRVTKIHRKFCTLDLNPWENSLSSQLLAVERYKLVFARYRTVTGSNENSTNANDYNCCQFLKNGFYKDFKGKLCSLFVI